MLSIKYIHINIQRSSIFLESFISPPQTTLKLEVRTTKLLSKDLMLSKKKSVEVYNCTHTETKDERPYPCVDKGCSWFQPFTKSVMNSMAMSRGTSLFYLPHARNQVESTHLVTTKYLDYHADNVTYVKASRPLMSFDD